ncbi:putative ABC transporter permease [Clostridioides difficile]|nr:putative ABC transporter permease [Clostridioides difficile]
MKVYFNKVYWDYSDYKYNSRGIVCLKFSVYWTILTFFRVQTF